MASKSSSKETIGRISERLLSGWKLLGDHCPLCNTPLMSKQNDLRCPGCDLPVVMEDDNSEAKYSNDVVDGQFDSDSIDDDASKDYLTQRFTNAYHAPSTAYNAPTKEEKEFQSLEEVKKEYDRQRKSSVVNQVSDKLGQYMLKGWTMLGSTCPMKECNGTPLMKDQKDPAGFMICVACDGKYQCGHGGDIVALTASLPSVGTPKSAESSILPPLFDISDAPILNLASNNDSDPSVQISKYLVKGWALLDEVCTNSSCDGNIPLMRDRNGVKHCVSCENSVTAAPTTATTTATSSSLVNNKVSASLSDDDDFNGDDDKIIYEKYAQQMLANSVVAVRDATGCQVTNTVLEKIHRITADLSSCKNIDECTKLTVLLQNLMTTYDTAKKLNL